MAERKNALHAHLARMSQEDREAFAARCGTSLGYINLVKWGHREPSAKLAHLIHKASGYQVSLQSLRPDIFGDVNG